MNVDSAKSGINNNPIRRMLSPEVEHSPRNQLLEPGNRGVKKNPDFSQSLPTPLSRENILPLREKSPSAALSPRNVNQVIRGSPRNAPPEGKIQRQPGTPPLSRTVPSPTDLYPKDGHMKPRNAPAEIKKQRQEVSPPLSRTSPSPSDMPAKLRTAPADLYPRDRNQTETSPENKQLMQQSKTKRPISNVNLDKTPTTDNSSEQFQNANLVSSMVLNRAHFAAQRKATSSENYDKGKTYIEKGEEVQVFGGTLKIHKAAQQLEKPRCLIVWSDKTTKKGALVSFASYKYGCAVDSIARPINFNVKAKGILTKKSPS